MSDTATNFEQAEPVKEYTTVESIFVRHRNVLMLKANFTPIFTDHYLHLSEQKLRFEEKKDAILKDLLGVLTLHAAARPWAETTAWTASIAEPRVNFFASAGSTKEMVVGTLFTEGVREIEKNLLYSQTHSPTSPLRKSTVEIKGSCPLRWIESYYKDSEQRPCRAFYLGNDDYLLLAAQPAYDQDWLEGLNTESAHHILEAEETKLLETRKFYFNCGCSEERLLRSLIGFKDNPEELFGDQEEIQATCPRCQTNYSFKRDIFEQIEIVEEETTEKKQETPNNSTNKP